MDNEALRRDILNELAFEPSLDATHIGVAVKDGIVTLGGLVASYAEKIAAEEAVRRVAGVRALAEELQIRYPGCRESSDEEIATRAANILAWDSTIPAEQIKVTVENGWITLTGEVDWNYQKEAAEAAVRKLSGLAGIFNLVTIGHREETPDIKRHVETALARSATLDDAGIHVGVSGRTVTLEGKVRAWYQRSEAERAAWSVPGVTKVDDRLIVG